MAKTSSGKRYAQAAFELALERNELESWQMGLGKVSNLTKDEELMTLIQNPRLPFDTKKEILQKKLSGVNPLVINLALLLASKGLLKITTKIIKQFNMLLDNYYGIGRAMVKTAFPIDDEIKEFISKRLAEIVNRKVLIDNEVDPNIIGGFVARLDDKLIDGSIRYRLETLRKNLIEAEK